MLVVHQQAQEVQHSEFQEQWLILPSQVEQTKLASRETVSSPERTSDGKAEGKPELEQLSAPPHAGHYTETFIQDKEAPDRYGTIVNFRDSDSELRTN